MKKCIYCLNVKNEKDFSKKEHVISEFLGTFSPGLKFQNDIVCNNCNEKLSADVENPFAEDTIIGIQLAMLGIRGRRTVRILGERVKMIITSNGELGVFRNQFPYITQKGITPRPCFLARNNHGAIQVLWIDEFSKIPKGNRKYKEIKKWLNKIKITERYIFANNEFPIEKTIGILGELGIPYKEIEREGYEDKKRGDRLHVEISGTMDDELRRFPCKIAFNYFSYCAKESGMTEILFKEEFDEIRNFILSGIRKNKNLPIRMTKEPTLYDEKAAAKRRPAHQVSFMYDRNRNMIISKISLLGVMDFEVDLGKYCLKIDGKEFGCGHFFDPLEEKWGDLYPSPIPIIKTRKFNLFNRRR